MHAVPSRRSRRLARLTSAAALALVAAALGCNELVGPVRDCGDEVSADVIMSTAVSGLPSPWTDATIMWGAPTSRCACRR